MPGADGSILIETELDTKGLQSGLSKLSSVIGGGLGTAMKAAGAALAGAGAAATAFAADAVSVGKEFDSSMSQVAATLGMTTEEIANNIDGAGDTFQALRDKAQEMGAATNFSASQAAEGLNILAMSGFDAEKSISMVEDVLHLAAAGSMDMASAAGFISGTMKGFADETNTSAYYANLMAKGATLANTDVRGLGDAMASGAAGAAAYKQSAESMTLALLKLAEQGEVGSAAGTALAAAMKNIYTPTDQARDALSELGVAAYDSYGNARDFNTVVNELAEALSGMTDEEANAYKQTIFGIQGLNAYNKMVVTGIEKQEEWAEALKEAQEGEGEAAKQYRTMTDNLQGDIDIWNSALDGLKITIADKLMPTVREFVQFGSDGLSKITEAFKAGGIEGAADALGSVLSDGITKILGLLPKVVDIGKQLVLSLLDGILRNSGTLASAAAEIGASIVSGIVEIIPRLALTGVRVVESLMKGIAEKLPELGTVIGDALGDLGEIFGDYSYDLVEAGADLIASLLKGVQNAIPGIIHAADYLLSSFFWVIESCGPDLINAGVELIEELLDGFSGQNLIGRLAGIASDLLDYALDAFSAVIDALVDAVPRLVELIVPALTDAVTQIADNLSALAPQLANAAMQLFSALGEALPAVVDSLVGAVPGLIGAVVDSIGAMLPAMIDAGVTIFSGLLEAVPGVLDLLGHFPGNDVAFFHHDFPGLGVHDIFRCDLSVDTGRDGKLLIIFIAAHAHEVIALGIKEQGIEQIGGALDAGGFAGLLALVDLDQAFFTGLGVVALFDGRHQALIL